MIRAGDYVVADSDGIVIVDPDAMEKTLERALEREEKERRIMAAMLHVVDHELEERGNIPDPVPWPHPFPGPGPDPVPWPPHPVPFQLKNVGDIF